MQNIKTKLLQLLPTPRARLIFFAVAVCLLALLATAAAAVIKNAGKPQSEATRETSQGAKQTGNEDTSDQADDQPKTDTPTDTPASSTSPGQASKPKTSTPSTGSDSPATGGGAGGGDTGGGSPASIAQSCPAYPAFPDAACTGVPAGTVLGTYTGPCTITVNNTVIDSKTVNCGLSIEAIGVVIKNSRINGTVATPNGSLAYSFSITDSEVIAPQATAIESTGIGEANFTALRVEVTGGNRSVYCRKNCTVQDSWVHGQNIVDSPRVHASGIRQSQNATLIHNRIHCSAEDTSSGGGCSANLTGYGDFEPVRDNLIEKNLFVATPAGACAYGGSSGDDGSKPYGDQAQNIIFKDNVFERGTGNCGVYFPITDFDDTRPGSQWTNNRWDDGAILPPAN